MSPALRGSILAFVLAAACGAPATLSRRPSSPEEIQQGRALYDRYCALCHGAGAVGYAADEASQLRNPTFLRTATDDFLRIAIERGRPGTPMSAFGAAHGGPLASADSERIIAYLRSLDSGSLLDVHERRIEGDPERGAVVFRERCATCHGASGEGKTALSLNNPTFLATASNGFIRYAIEQGRPGTPMPAFGSVLSSNEIDDVTLAIRRWERAPAPPASGASGALPSLERIVQNPNGPRPTFTLREGRFVPADEVAEALRAGARMVLLDARPISDWHRGHIPGAHPTPFHDDVSELAKALPRDGTWIVAYCACPHAASGKVVDALRELGFANTAVLDEGILVWEQRGHPMAATAAKPAAK